MFQLIDSLLVMMIFSITAIDKHRKTRYFTYGLADLGADLDFIHKLVAEGHALVSVQLFDQDRTSDLPVETFKAVSASTTLAQLERQWKAILKAPPVSSSAGKQKTSRWVDEWVCYLEGEITRKEQTITDLSTVLQVALGLHQAKLTTTVVDRYNSMLTKQTRLLTKLYTIRYRLLNR